MKSEKGITLISLAVTIIVLGILAGYSVMLSIGDNDSTIKQVKEETQKQQNIIDEEEKKTNNVISSLEEEWGLN